MGEIWAARLGDTAIVGTPGEVFGEIGAAVRAASPAPVTIFAGYSNGVLGYIATPEEYPYGGYEPAVAQRGYAHPAPFSPDVAGIIRDTALELLASSSRRAVRDRVPVPAAAGPRGRASRAPTSAASPSGRPSRAAPSACHSATGASRRTSRPRPRRPSRARPSRAARRRWSRILRALRRGRRRARRPARAWTWRSWSGCWPSRAGRPW